MRFLVGLIVVFMVIGCGGKRELSRQGLKDDLKAIQSAAAEGALLSSDVARGRTTSAFTEVHRRELSGQARAVVEKLEIARPAAGLEDDRRIAQELATGVLDDLERLDDASREEAARIARQLEAAARRAGREAP